MGLNLTWVMHPWAHHIGVGNKGQAVGQRAGVACCGGGGCRIGHWE